VSRAFVKESDRDEVIAAPGPELPPGVPNRITPAGARRFRDELAALQAERAALRGAEGAEERARMAVVAARLAWLERRVPTFEETPTPASPSKVVFGSVVVLSDADGVEKAWQIVGVDEADPSAGRVSWAAPLAKAALGRSEGDAVRIDTPKGAEEYELIAVRAPGPEIWSR
jgi:transcription elongation factor GreB